MCGIAGVVRFEGAGEGARGSADPSSRGPAASRAAAERMASALRHRGPDGLHAWTSDDGRVALGHTRLVVIDPEGGGQPMPNEDGSVRLVYNGEIYGFRELRSELEAAGHRFRSRSDTEVVVHGYEEWGDDVVHRLHGMFAFAVWDARRGRLLLARDRTGKKPLYWARIPGGVAFASEVGALLAHPDVPDELDPRAIPLYLAYGYVPDPGTFRRGIRSLPPAHRLVAESDGTVTEERWWRLDFRSGEMGREEAVGEVRTRLESAVERRLVADVPLGAFLSGGVDSTLIVGLMSRMKEDPVRTFSIGFADDPTYDETEFARLASRRFGTEHTEFTVEAESVELVDRLLDAYGEPFGDSSAIPTWIVSRLTREHVTVALTGDGGDELFAGYPRFLGAVIAERIPRWAARLGDAVGRRLPHHPDFRSLPRRFQRFFAAAALPAEERTLRWIGFVPEGLDRWLRPGLRDLLPRDELLAHFREPLERAAGESPLSRALQLNFETYLPEDLLVKADRCSMAHGLELRSPFLDTGVMELAAELPDRLRIRRGRLKWILREAFPDLLPPVIAGRGKMGFGIPLPTWLRTRWRPLVEERVVSEGSALREWLEPEPVATLWREHLAGEADHGHALWALLTLATWLERRR